MKLYHQCRRMFPEINSKMVMNFLRFHFTTPNWKLRPEKPPKPSILVDYQSFSIKLDLETEITNLWLRFSRKNFPLFGKYLYTKIKDFSQVKLIRIFQRHGKLYCKLSHVQQVSKPKNSNKIIGLDFNTKNIVLSNNKFYKFDQLFHRKMEHHKNNQKSRSLSNFTKDTIHKLTSELVKNLQSKGQEVLVLEDLSNIRKFASRKLKTSKGRRLNYIINSMPFYMFRQFLEYKCLEHGIRLELVNPKNTSKICSKCGSLNTQRPTQSKFQCLDCGFQLNADLNGSRNIRDRYMHPEWATSESSPMGY